MSKIVVSESVTVDGFVDAERFVPFNSDERNACMRETVFVSDALLVGRTTYELLAPAWSGQKNGMADWMNRVPKYVVASKPLNAKWNNATVIKDNVVEEIAKLKRQPGQDSLILGSATLVQSLMQAGLIDQYKLLVHPVIAGSGKRFFKDGTGLPKLKLVECRSFSLGVVLLCYEATE